MFTGLSTRPITIMRLFSTARLRKSSGVLICTVLFVGQVALSPISRSETPRPNQQNSRKEIPLPTPLSHYEKFKKGASGLPLLMDLVTQFNPEIQQVLLSFAKASGLQDIPSTPELDSDVKKLQSLAEAAGITKGPAIPKEQAVSLLRQVNWAPVRPLLLEFFVHQSRVLDIIPEMSGALWGPIVHDALLYFLDHLSDD